MALIPPITPDNQEFGYIGYYIMTKINKNYFNFIQFATESNK